MEYQLQNGFIEQLAMLVSGLVDRICKTFIGLSTLEAVTTNDNCHDQKTIISCFDLFDIARDL